MFIGATAGGSVENRSLTSIRGLAALWVVALHITASSVSASKIADMGYTAVDVFFILSGMVISGVYSDLNLSNIGDFWLRRIFRVYPAHISSLFILTIIALEPLNFEALWNTIANLPYAGSVLLLQPYIHLQASMNPVAWSVGIELCCYALFPLAFMLLRRMRPDGFAAISLLLLLLAIEWETARNFGGSIYGVSALSRGLVGFSLGMMMWRVGSGITMNLTGASMLEAAALMGIASSIVANRPELIPVWSAVLLFGLSYDVGLLAIILRSGWLHWLGAISFSVYLLHYPMALVVEKWLPIRTAFSLEEPLRLVTIVALTLAASTISYWFVEKPCRRIPAFLSRRRAVSRGWPGELGRGNKLSPLIKRR